MIEKNPQKNNNPNLKEELRHKEKEVETILSFIPQVDLHKETLRTLERELKQSVFSLLRKKPKNLWENFKNRYEEWINRSPRG
jgi:hypothetical protein